MLAARAAVLDRAMAALTEKEKRTLTVILEKSLTAATEDRNHADVICRLCDWKACPEADCPVDQAALCRAAP